jgi:hypothetical protein
MLEGKVTQYKFSRKSLGGSNVLPYGQTEMTDLMVVFRNCFAEAPKTPLKQTGCKNLDWIQLAQQ